MWRLEGMLITMKGLHPKVCVSKRTAYYNNGTDAYQDAFSCYLASTNYLKAMCFRNKILKRITTKDSDVI